MIRKEIRVTGIVQGVGFRPYVYRLATDRNLGGSISNTSSGVTIEIQGPAEIVEDFISRLPEEAPALAQITDVFVREIPCRVDGTFEILSSRAGEHANTLISPDVAVCADCLRELLDASDRRYLYPFINCTNCGPRFTIVRGVPYDRPRTSMSIFPMCERCAAEYHDPRNRRFHAQPNACWDCGPRLELLDAEGRRIPSADPAHAADAANPIEKTVALLRAAHIVAIKGLGGFHLTVDATNSDAVERLRERKRRADKPFALMMRDAATAARFCAIDAEAESLLVTRQAPIVLLPKIKGSAIADSVAPKQSDLGIFLPYTPLHHLLFAAGKFDALVMTSANLSEEPIAIDNREAIERLGKIATFFLVHDRDILTRCDDSVARFAAGRMRQIRRSRGYVPAPVQLHKSVSPILAVGGELKNTICLTRGNQAFLSQHIGDLENIEAFDFFRHTVGYLSRILDMEAATIAYDLHPEYLSTKWALAQTGKRLVGVQHHHAHIAACMAENHLDGQAIGLSLDGTGYGTDGCIWGGEVLLAGYAGFERRAHLGYVPLPGGTAAIREPWRMAVSYLEHAFGEKFRDLNIPFVRKLDRKKTEIMLQLIAKRINSPLTSSSGRLFDAVAALIGIRESVNYEAQAAIELEMPARESRDESCYPFEIVGDNGGWIIETRPLFEAIVEDLRRNIAAGSISRRFHNGFVDVFTRVANLVREKSSINRVCLSGGTFHNVLVFEDMIRKLEAHRFEVFTQSEVPCGDGGLSLGQAMVAAHAEDLIASC